MKEAKKCEPPFLALDLGGTKIIAAVISDKGQVLAKGHYLTAGMLGAAIFAFQQKLDSGEQNESS